MDLDFREKAHMSKDGLFLLFDCVEKELRVGNKAIEILMDNFAICM